MDENNQNQPNSANPVPVSVNQTAKAGSVIPPWIWIVLLVLAVVIAGVLVYLVFFRDTATGPSFSDDASLVISGPDEVISGETAEYLITIENNSNATLSDMTLEVFYPRGFLFEDVESDDLSSTSEQNNTFSLNNLAVGESHELKISGLLQGSVQEIKTISANLFYEPLDFRSRFQLSQSFSSEILAPELSIEIAAPDQVIIGQRGEYRILVSNQSDQDYEDLVITTDFPDDFEFIESIPESDGGEGERWLIGNLNVAEEEEIVLQGRILSDPGRELTFQVELSDRGVGGELLSLVKSFTLVQTEATPFFVSHRPRSGDLISSDAVAGGERVRYELEYENRGRTALRNVVIELELNPEAFNFNQLSSGTAQRDGNRIVWIPAVNPDLLTVAPGQGGDFNFTIQVADTTQGGLSQNLVAVSRLSYTADELIEPGQGNTIELKVQTRTIVEASVVPVGGVIPPENGEVTEYEVSLEVSNTVNEIRNTNIIMTAPNLQTNFLADTVSPAEKSRVSYVPGAQTIRWNIGNLPALTGLNSPKRVLRFRIQAQNRRDILTDIQLTGIDTFTENQVFSELIDDLSFR